MGLDIYQKALLDSIDIIVQERLKNLGFNYYITAKVTNDNGNGTYNVEYNDQTLANLKVRSGLTLLVGDIVLICVVNGNFSDKFIDCVRP